MNSENAIPEELVPAVLEKASRLYQQPNGGTYSLEALMATGSEVSITVAERYSGRTLQWQNVTVAERSAANEDMQDAIANFQTYAANNQELRSSELFVNLQYEVAGTENRLATERMRYNQAIEDYNRRLQPLG